MDLLCWAWSILGTTEMKFHCVLYAPWFPKHRELKTNYSDYSVYVLLDTHSFMRLYALYLTGISSTSKLQTYTRTPIIWHRKHMFVDNLLFVFNSVVVSIPFHVQGGFIWHSCLHINISSRSTLYWRRRLRCPGRSSIYTFPKMRARWGKSFLSAVQDSRKLPIAKTSNQVLKLLDRNVSCMTRTTNFGGPQSILLERHISRSIVKRNGASAR